MLYCVKHASVVAESFAQPASRRLFLPALSVPYLLTAPLWYCPPTIHAAGEHSGVQGGGSGATTAGGALPGAAAARTATSRGNLFNLNHIRQRCAGPSGSAGPSACTLHTHC